MIFSCKTPFFGLCNPCLLASLYERSGLECGIRYLREVASSAKLDSVRAFIMYTHPQPFKMGARKFQCVECMSALPISFPSKKRNHDGTEHEMESYIRWLHIADVTDTKKFYVSTAGNHGMEAFIQKRSHIIHCRGEFVTRCCQHSGQVPDRLFSTCPFVSHGTWKHFARVFEPTGSSYESGSLELDHFTSIAGHGPLHLFRRGNYVRLPVTRSDSIPVHLPRQAIGDIQSGLHLLQAEVIDPRVLYD